MDILIVAQFLGDLEHLENTNGRFIYLGQMLSEKHDVEIITTTFLHGKKGQAHFTRSTYNGCKITPIYEPGYPKNVCLKRLASHKVLAENIANYLKQRKQPDVVYAAVPSLSVAETAANYCKKNGIRFIIDVQDLWPEAFNMVFHVPVLSKAVFWPMQKQADKIYAAADQIVAVSDTYAERALKANKKCKEPLVVYLGTDKVIFDQYASKGCVDFEGIVIAYAGSLSKSYDLCSVIDAIHKLHCSMRVKLLIMGDGFFKQELERKAQEKGIVCEFTGNLPYSQMIERLSKSDIAVNPIHKGSAGSILNKAADYAMAGLPVVNTQECQEYRDLLDEYHAGLNCRCEDSDDIMRALQKLIENPELRKNMGQSSRRMGKERFAREVTYKTIVRDLLEHRGGGSIHRVCGISRI